MLEQHHLDLFGLALLATALFLGFVLYAGWDGGSAGSGLEVGLRWVGGAVAYAVPILLAGLGTALIVRPLIRYPGAINAGALLLVAGLLLAFAAETAGLGPNQPARGEISTPSTSKPTEGRSVRPCTGPRRPSSNGSGPTSSPCC